MKRLFGRGVCMCIGHLYKIDYVLGGKEGRKGISTQGTTDRPAKKKKKEKKEMKIFFSWKKKKKENP